MKARYSGTCLLCMGPIELGQEIEKVEDPDLSGWAHAECVVKSEGELPDLGGG